MISKGRQSGLTLTELLIGIVLGGLILVAFNELISSSLAIRRDVEADLASIHEADFAMSRMVRAARRSRQLLLPMTDNPATNWPENLRSQTNPPSPPIGDSLLATAVMAVALPPDWDIDNDGFSDADNDADGRIDEDLPADAQNDGKSGIRDIDDNGNGVEDFPLSPSDDDDESFDLAANEDPVNGVDDDGDGHVDEDPGADINGDGAPGLIGVDDDGDGDVDEGDAADDDEDGLVDEDWLDPLVYYLDGATLIERRPVPWDANGDSMVTGLDWVESVIAENVTSLEFERIPVTGTEKQRLAISLTVIGPNNAPFSLTTAVRVGGSVE